MPKTKVVSHSELDTYRQCRLKHQLAYRELWGTDDISPALSRGSLFHLVMEVHYRAIKAGWSMEESRQLIPSIPGLLWEEGTGEQTEEQEKVEWIFHGYLDLYGPDSPWTIVAVEHRLEEWLPTERGTRSSFKMAGTVDLVVRDSSAGGGLWIVDHKTCKDLPKEKDLDMEDQTGIYTYLLRRRGANIRGAIYNHCRTYKLKTREMESNERFRRTFTVRTDEELRVMALEGLDLMREAYRPRRGDAPRSPNGDTCRWKCGFTEPCLAGRKGGDMRGMLQDTGFEQKETKPGPTFQKGRTR